jgi:peptidoglycan/xylan/chitin deacetylase (PgdA/CDA1 family)
VVRRAGLTFHDVVAPDRRSESGFQGVGPDHYKVAPERFVAHLGALPAGADGIELTFDDGGASALATAELLESRDRRGRFFVVADRIGTEGFLDEDGCRELLARGHVIGSHGLTHRALTPLSDREVEDEWRLSRERLESVLGAEVTTASVPRGFYDRRIGRLAAAAGYRELYTSEPWLRPRRLGTLTVVGRFSVTEDTSPERVAALASFAPRAIATTAVGWHARKAAKRVLGPAYERVRARGLSRRA